MAVSSFNVFRLFGDLLHILSIAFLWHKISTSRSCSGLSLKSQILFMVVYTTRYLDIFYWSFSLKHFYNFIMKCLFIGSQGMVLWSMWFKYRSSWNAKLDTVKLEYLIVPCLLLGLFLFDHGSHRGGHSSSFSAFLMFREYCWTFSILLESIAILPQMFMLSASGEAEAITTHYLLCLGLYRAFYLLNWIWRFVGKGPSPDAVSVLAGVLQTALYSDFFYIYYKRVFSGRAFKLPV